MLLVLLIDDEEGIATGADDVAVATVLAQRAQVRGVDWERLERSEARSPARVRAWDWARRVTTADTDVNADRVGRGRSCSNG